MKKFILTALILLGFLCTICAQEVTFNVVKNNGTTAAHIMSSDAKIYYSDTQLFLDSNGEIVTYNLSELRKAYFTTNDNIEETDNQQLAVYPNPANDVLRIDNLTDNQSVTIYSINGAIVKKVIASHNTIIDISDLRTGLYIIGVDNKFSKFIKM